MNFKKFYIFITMAIMISSLKIKASDRENATISLASAVLTEIQNTPDWANVAELLENCVAIGIFPDLKKAGYLIGGQFGRGVILHRLPRQKKWSAPAFYKIHGGSIGFQIGIQEIDLILIFSTEDAFRQFMNEGIKVGINLAAAAGPHGRDLRKAHKEPVYAYSRSKGLFAGVSISGAKLTFDYDGSKSFYGDAFSPEMILLHDEIEEIPEEALKLITRIKQIFIKGYSNDY